MSQIIYQTITTIKNTEKSQVCLAFMEGREEMVIIKRMNIANPEVYKALTEVHNEHIPQIYAWEWQENELVVAEEYIDGETLEYYLREGLLTEEQKLKIALQLCEAVKVLHNCVPQIIHRDIKGICRFTSYLECIKLRIFLRIFVTRCYICNCNRWNRPFNRYGLYCICSYCR